MFLPVTDFFSADSFLPLWNRYLGTESEKIHDTLIQEVSFQAYFKIDGLWALSHMTHRTCKRYYRHKSGWHFCRLLVLCVQLWKSLPEKPDQGPVTLHRNTMMCKLQTQKDFLLAGSKVGADHLVP